MIGYPDYILDTKKLDDKYKGVSTTSLYCFKSNDVSAQHLGFGFLLFI
jgi:hypothetical protein